jgi:hypothetical protein
MNTQRRNTTMTENSTKQIGEMTSSELENYILDIEELHRVRMRKLKALFRAQQAEEAFLQPRAEEDASK